MIRVEAIWLACGVSDLRAGMGGFQRRTIAKCNNAPTVHQNASMRDMARSIRPQRKGITGKGQHLSKDKVGHVSPALQSSPD